MVRGAPELAGMREVSGRRPRVCATSVFFLRVCGNPLDRLVLDQRAGDLVTPGFPVSLVKLAAVEHSRTSFSTYAGR